MTDAAGLVTSWPTIGSCWGDYDNDGRQDLFVSNSLGRSQLFHNNGDGTFTEVGRDAGIDMYGLGSICYFIDYDNDGWLDIVQNVWSDSEDVIHTMQNGEGPPTASRFASGATTATVRSRSAAANSASPAAGAA